jgi:hypothetical protein
MLRPKFCTVLVSRHQLLARVGAEEDHFPAVVQHARFLKDRCQRGARPPCDADTADEPGKAMVAGALQREDDLAPRPRPKLLEREGERLRGPSADLEGPALAVDHRPVVVADRKELLVGRDPGIQLLPAEQIAHRVGLGILRRLIQPGKDLLARLARKRMCQEREVDQRQSAKGGAALAHEISA